MWGKWSVWRGVDAYLVVMVAYTRVAYTEDRSNLARQWRPLLFLLRSPSTDLVHRARLPRLRTVPRERKVLCNHFSKPKLGQRSR
jgi:hypothetical protein